MTTKYNIKVLKEQKAPSVLKGSTDAQEGEAKRLTINYFFQMVYGRVHSGPRSAFAAFLKWLSSNKNRLGLSCASSADCLKKFKEFKYVQDYGAVGIGGINIVDGNEFSFAEMGLARGEKATNWYVVSPDKIAEIRKAQGRGETINFNPKDHLNLHKVLEELAAGLTYTAKGDAQVIDPDKDRKVKPPKKGKKPKVTVVSLEKQRALRRARILQLGMQRIITQFEHKGDHKKEGGAGPNAAPEVIYPESCLDPRRIPESVLGLILGRQTGAPISKATVRLVSRSLRKQGNRTLAKEIAKELGSKKLKLPGTISGWVLTILAGGLFYGIAAGTANATMGTNFKAPLKTLDDIGAWVGNLVRMSSDSTCFYTAFMIGTVVSSTNAQFLGKGFGKFVQNSIGSGWNMSKAAMKSAWHKFTDSWHIQWKEYIRLNPNFFQETLDTTAAGAGKEEIEEFMKFLAYTNAGARGEARVAATVTIDLVDDGGKTIIVDPLGIARSAEKSIPLEKALDFDAVGDLTLNLPEVAQGQKLVIRTLDPDSPGPLTVRRPKTPEEIASQGRGKHETGTEWEDWAAQRGRDLEDWVDKRPPMRPKTEEIDPLWPAGPGDAVTIDLAMATRGAKRLSVAAKKSLQKQLKKPIKVFAEDTLKIVETLRIVLKNARGTATQRGLTGEVVEKPLLHILRTISDNWTDLAESVAYKVYAAEVKLLQAQGKTWLQIKELLGEVPKGAEALLAKSEGKSAAQLLKEAEEILEGVAVQVEVTRALSRQVFDQFGLQNAAVSKSFLGKAREILTSPIDQLGKGPARAVTMDETNVVAANATIKRNLKRIADLDTELIPAGGFGGKAARSADDLGGAGEVSAARGEVAIATRNVKTLAKTIGGGIFITGGKIALLGWPIWATQLAGEILKREGPTGWGVPLSPGAEGMMRAGYAKKRWDELTSPNVLTKGMNDTEIHDVKSLLKAFIFKVRKENSVAAAKEGGGVAYRPSGVITPKNRVLESKEDHWSLLRQFEEGRKGGKSGIHGFLAHRTLLKYWQEVTNTDIEIAKKIAGLAEEDVVGMPTRASMKDKVDPKNLPQFPTADDKDFAAKKRSEYEDLIKRRGSEANLTEKSNIKENLRVKLIIFLDMRLLDEASVHGKIFYGIPDGIFPNAAEGNITQEETMKALNTNLNKLLLDFVDSIDPKHEGKSTGPAPEKIGVDKALQEVKDYSRLELKKIVGEMLNENSGMGYSSLNNPYPMGRDTEDEPEEDIDAEFQSYLQIFSQSPSYDLAIEMAKRLVYEREVFEELLHLASHSPELKEEIVEKIFRGIKT